MGFRKLESKKSVCGLLMGGMVIASVKRDGDERSGVVFFSEARILMMEEFEF